MYEVRVDHDSDASTATVREFAGLAGYTDAPILLTRGGSLHGGVADFVEDHGVSTVYVLGGTAAVSDSVDDGIRAVATGEDGVAAGGGLSLLAASLPSPHIGATTVRYEATTARVANLPRARDLVETAAGAGQSDDADADEPGEQPCEREQEVIFGFLADNPNTLADDLRNGYSQVRIKVSPNVKAP